MDRYLINFDLDNINKEHADIIIIGGGIAGLYSALQISKDANIIIITKDEIEMSNTILAQGGIAAPISKDDSPELHFKDTIYAGVGLCNEDAVWTLVNEAYENIDIIRSYGINFDTQDGKKLALSKEGAHSKKRIIHTGDSTGREVFNTLFLQAKKQENIKVFEKTYAIDVLTKESKCEGVIAKNENSDKQIAFMAPIVICASGGYGRLYSHTTNPEVANGDGVAIAYRAGAALADLEFVQFHPTVLSHEKNKSFLISEAVRGEGARLYNSKDERFMKHYHEMGDLAPRDVVSRAIASEIEKTGTDSVFLDITHKDSEFVMNRFPTIYNTCLKYGIDITKDRIPVSPAEHYCMGGIATDIDGKTNIEGFYACGEVARCGIHGANRLASNSLLEGLVFGRRIGKYISEKLDKQKTNKKIQIVYNVKTNKVIDEIEIEKKKQALSQIMNKYAGMIRSEKGLNIGLKKIEAIGNEFSGLNSNSSSYFELQNMIQIGKLLLKAAIERQESRGGHYRSDYPKTDDVNWKKSIVHQRNEKECKNGNN